MRMAFVLKTEFAVIVAVVTLGALYGAIASPATSDAYQPLAEDLEPFRSEFNAAAEDVRAVLIVGPT